MAQHEWPAERVAEQFEEAVRTLRKLPPVKAQGYFNFWAQIARTAREIVFMEPELMGVGATCRNTRVETEFSLGGSTRDFMSAAIRLQDDEARGHWPMQQSRPRGRLCE